MSNISVFEIMGPIMIGPSSSHTAGAEKLGKAASSIWGRSFDAVEFYLHGSFAKTYKGHGTDKALVAGILGMSADDERLRDSMNIAESRGIKTDFIEVDLGDVHPNTVKIVIKDKDQLMLTLVGSSIGGGNIIITEVDGSELEISGQYPVIIATHKDTRGMVSKITGVIAEHQLNIATLEVSRESRGETATTVIEIDSAAPDSIINEILQIENVISVRVLNAIE
ncbi:MAG: L-serine dehydratase, iron-sulfur-dependent subunit beta [Clostridiales bacterium GWB2_37_7]|nr:MAG: L-serine dehydratase, iron-sulfur-dependent subunit beta [Clostridiales bacterium GWB2_37_7]